MREWTRSHHGSLGCDTRVHLGVLAYLGVAHMSTPKHTQVHQSTHEYTRVHTSTHKHTWVYLSIPESPRVHQTHRGPPNQKLAHWSTLHLSFTVVIVNVGMLCMRVENEHTPLFLPTSSHGICHCLSHHEEFNSFQSPDLIFSFQTPLPRWFQN